MPNHQKILAAFFIFLLACLFSPPKIFAQVVINEFSSNSNPEWVELYNNSDNPVDITGWSLKDEGQAAKPIAGIIPGHGYFIFENPDGWLNNSGGDTIALFDNFSTPNQINGVVYGQPGSVVGTPNVDKSAGRIPDGSSNWENQLVWTKLAANSSSPTSTQIPNPTSTSIPSTPTPTSTPAANDYENISISEYLPFPESGNEWVELYNDNDSEVNLGGWWIDDVADPGGSPHRAISGTISPHGYKQFFLGDAFLNNDGDDVRLLNGSQDEKDNTSFEVSTKGKSWAMDSNGNWCQVDPTPNSSNSSCPAATATTTPIPTSTISLTPTPTKKITPTLTPTPKTTPATATGSGEILGQESSPAAFYPWEATEEAKSASQSSSSSQNRLLPAILLGAGFILLFSAAFWLWYTQLRNES